MKLKVKITDHSELLGKAMRDFIAVEFSCSTPGTEFTGTSYHTPEALEDLEAHIESIAFQIRDFRMNNFPESTEIE